MSNVETLLGKIRRKYKEYGIQEKPFVIVKADAGTYGMGIMTVRDPKDLDDLNRRTRNKMSVIKDGQEVSEVILQEGVPTYERVNDAVAEPVVYMIDRYVVGGFYRVHAERGIDENLNAPGRELRAAGLRRASNQLPKPGAKPGASAPNRFYMYGVIAPAGDGGGELRARGDRPGRRDLRVARAPARRAALLRRSTMRVACDRLRTMRAALAARRRRDPAAVPPPALAALTLGAIGVVYGDIGTSPLYALKEVFAHGHVPLTAGQHLRRPVDGLLDADGRRLAQVRGADPARRQQRRGRPDRDAGAGLAGGDGPAGAAPAAAGARHLRHRDLLRRRRHHAGDLGAVGGRGPRGRGAGAARATSCRSRWSC